MSGITTNAADVARAIRRRTAAWDGALNRAMRKSLVALYAESERRLMGGENPPWTYPVPNRSFQLRRSLDTQQRSAVEGYVINKAPYARAIHSGEISVGRGRRRRMKTFTARPFFADAVRAVNVPEIYRREFEAVL